MEGKALKSILKDKGIKQVWVADKLKVKKAQVNQWVNDVYPIPEKYKVELKHILSL